MSTKKKKPLNNQERKLKKILQQIAGDVDNIEGELIPGRRIRGSGAIYCYCPQTKEFVYVPRGAAVYIIDSLKDDNFLIYTITGYIVRIAHDELELVGFD